MNTIYKRMIKAIILIFSLLIISSFLINILYYFDVISIGTTKYLKMFLAIFSYFIGGIYIGKNSPNKGYIYGLKLSVIIVFIMIILGIIFHNLKVTRIIYYLITTFAITFGAMIGINKK